MPFTEPFKKLRRKYEKQYSDKAKAQTFAFEEAFQLDIPTFEERRARFWKEKKGQKTVSGFLYWFMAVIIMALFMPTVRTAIINGMGNISTNVTNYVLIRLFILYWPIYLGVMVLIILIVILTSK